jgi:uncharacterized ion transporter superfamily protein YfcC
MLSEDEIKRDISVKQPSKKMVETTPEDRGDDQPATLLQKIVVVVLGLYLISLIYLVLSKHWLAVLPF